jgi:hypothetical protein
MTTSQGSNLAPSLLTPETESSAYPSPRVSNTEVYPDSEEGKITPKSKNPLIILLLSIVLIIILAGGAYLFWYNTKPDGPKPTVPMTPTLTPSIIPTETSSILKTYIGSTDFSFTYSDQLWRLEESIVEFGVPGTIGSYKKVKLINLYDNFSLDIDYKPLGNPSKMIQYGSADGEFEVSGNIAFLGETLSRDNLINGGRIVQVQYNRASEFTRGKTRFVLAINPTDFEGALEESNIEQAEIVLKSFKLLPEDTNTASKMYISPILEDFSVDYPSSWDITVEEKLQYGESKIMANKIFFTKKNHTLEIAISPLVEVGSTPECIKNGDMDYDLSVDLVKVFNKNASGILQYNTFTYLNADDFFTKDHNYAKFVQVLENQSIDSANQPQYIACGVFDISSAEKSIYTVKQSTFADVGVVDPDSKLMATVIIRGSYLGGQNVLIQNEMDDIVKSILKR